MSPATWILRLAARFAPEGLGSVMISCDDERSPLPRSGSLHAYNFSASGNPACSVPRRTG
jgi:hypothetical protein